MKKYLAEFIGTFFLMLAIVTVVGGGVGDLAPIAIGTALIGMIYAGGHISAAHYNPAVTFAFYLVGGCTRKDVPGYLIAQLLAAVLAAILGEYLVGEMGGELKMAGNFDFTAGTIAEFLGTFALVYVILNVAIAKGTAGNSHYGIAIGFTVIGMVYAIGGISGGAFNPAVVVGLVVAKMTSTGNLAAFLIGQFLAAVAAAYTFKYLISED